MPTEWQPIPRAEKGGMAEKEKSLQEWLAQERQRLEEGFTYEPEPPGDDVPPAANDILAGLGLGAGILAGAAAGHANPATFQGVKASTIAAALRSELSGGTTHVEVGESAQATTVTIYRILQPHQHAAPALTVTLIESGEILTVAVSDLSQAARRGVLGALGRTAVRQGGGLLLRRRGLIGMLDAAGNLAAGVEDVTAGIQDLNLPKRVWAVIERVGTAAESSYLQEQSRREASERERREAERAWTHCEWCGRAYGPEEEGSVQCRSCGAPRGPRPPWLT